MTRKYLLWTAMGFYAIAISALIALTPSAVKPTAVWNAIIFDRQASASSLNPIFYRQSLGRLAIFDLPRELHDVKSKWITEYINVGIHDAPKSSAISDGSQVYVGGDDSWVRAIDLKGKTVWKAYLGDAARGIHSSPAIDQDSLYIGSYGGVLYRFDKKTGRIIWARKIADAIGASPLIFENTLIVAVEANRSGGSVVRIAKSDGRLLWQTDDLGAQAHSSPSLDEKLGLVLVGANDSTLHAFDVNDGKQRWKTSHGGEIKSSIVISDHVAFVTTFAGEMIAMKVDSGEILWSQRLAKKSMVSPVVLPASGLVVAASSAADIVAFHILEGKPEWSYRTGMPGMKSSPIVVRSAETEKIIAICGVKQLCLFSAKGAVEKRWWLQGAFSGSPFIDGKNLYLSYDEGGLEAFELIFELQRFCGEA